MVCQSFVARTFAPWPHIVTLLPSHNCRRKIICGRTIFTTCKRSVTRSLPRIRKRANPSDRTEADIDRRWYESPTISLHAQYERLARSGTVNIASPRGTRRNVDATGTSSLRSLAAGTFFETIWPLVKISLSALRLHCRALLPPQPT
jgi:hypothetical protein